MGLITCPDCGRRISESASMCLGCGRPIDSPRCIHCGQPANVRETANDDSNHVRSKYFITESPPGHKFLNKKHLLYERGIKYAAQFRGTDTDPIQELQRYWEGHRNALITSAPPEVRDEYLSLKRDQRRRIHKNGQWRHSETGDLFMALEAMFVHTHQVAKIVSAWFRHPEYDDDVQAFLRGSLAADPLYKKAVQLFRLLPES